MYVWRPNQIWICHWRNQDKHTRTWLSLNYSQEFVESAGLSTVNGSGCSVSFRLKFFEIKQSNVLHNTFCSELYVTYISIKSKYGVEKKRLSLLLA